MHLESFLSLPFGSSLSLPPGSFLSLLLRLLCCYLLIRCYIRFSAFATVAFFSASPILVINPEAFYYILQDFCYLLFLKLAYLIYLSLLRNFSYLLTLRFSPVARYTSFCSKMASNAVRSSFACFISALFPFFVFSTFQIIEWILLSLSLLLISPLLS